MINRQLFSFFSSKNKNTNAISISRALTYGSLEILPDEVIREILSYLPSADFQRFARVNVQMYTQLSVEKLFNLEHMRDLNYWSFEGCSLQDFNKKITRYRGDLKSANDKFERSLQKEERSDYIYEMLNCMTESRIVTVGACLLYCAYLIVMAMMAMELAKVGRVLTIGYSVSDELLMRVVLPACAFVSTASLPPLVLAIAVVCLDMWLKCTRLERGQLWEERQVVAALEQSLKVVINDFQSYHLPSNRGGK